MARLFHSYLVIVNAARMGLRQAVTGDFNPSYCAACTEADKVAVDNARLLTILDVVNGTTGTILRKPAVNDTNPGWFKATVCNSNPGFVYVRSADKCMRNGVRRGLTW